MARHYRRVPFKVCGRAAEDEESGVSTRGSVQCMLQQDCSLPRPRRACKQEAATRNIFVDGRRLCRRREEGAEHLFGQWRLHGGRNFRKLSALRRVPPRFTFTHRAGGRPVTVTNLPRGAPGRALKPRPRWRNGLSLSSGIRQTRRDSYNTFIYDALLNQEHPPAARRAPAAAHSLISRTDSTSICHFTSVSCLPFAGAAFAFPSSSLHASPDMTSPAWAKASEAQSTSVSCTKVKSE